MIVRGIIIEQIDWNGTSKTLSIQFDPSLGDLVVAFPQDYDESRSSPFHFQNPNYQQKFDRNSAECKARKLTPENFFKEDELYIFKTLHHNIPTKNRELTYYSLYLPEYAVPLTINCYDPQNPDRQFKRTVLKDDQKPRYLVYLRCSSKYGYFNFNLECKFKEDKEGFGKSKYSDKYQTELYAKPGEWQRLVNKEDRLKTQKFFADKIIINKTDITNNYESSQINLLDEPKKKSRFGIGIFTIGSFVIALIVLLFGNNIWEKFSGKNTTSEYFTTIINDVYYLTDSSQSETYPDAFKQDDNGIISQDETTQNETLRRLWLDKKPIIKFSISNTNSTKSFTLLGVYLELNSKEYLLKISTQYDKDDPIICPPNSKIEYTGVPISYPVYKIENNMLHCE